jgi:uncharacterized membrane protein
MSQKLISVLKATTKTLSLFAVLLAVLFFAASLSPSLLPRPFQLQGVLSGFALASGYGCGVLLVLIWDYLELPHLQGKLRRVVLFSVGIVCLGLAVTALIYCNSWQNDLRLSMGLEANESGQMFSIAIIALLVALLILAVIRLFIYLSRRVSTQLKRRVPERPANLIGMLLIASVVMLLVNDIFIKNFLRSIDEVYALSDAATEPGVEQPSEAIATGSPASLLDWDTLGRTGENFVTTGPRKDDLDQFFEKPVLQPLRVYVGYRSADSFEARAQLALQELIRVGGFNRSKLIIATPTGTGWLDPSAVDTLEYIHRGDTAIVTMQYSYLPSWLTLWLDPQKAKASAAALYRAIHTHWRTLPVDSRPELYLYGLSLGSHGAETSIALPSLISDPIQGGVFAGPPFLNSISPRLARVRNPGSPYWLPVIQDSSLVRFTAQENALNIPGAQWGPMRFVYIQYASDPMVFFSTDLYWREPEWMKGERGHDVSPALTWYPVVTFLQIMFDLPMADRIPKGNAHNYAARSYIDAWVEVTEPKDWDKADSLRLKALFADR